MIVRGTTPYHSFILPIKSDKISELYVTYLQNEEVILEKHIGDDGVVIEDSNFEMENASVEPLEDNSVDPSSKLTVHLTQEDTLKFHFYPAARKNIAVIQIRILDVDGEAYASDPVNERVFGVLKDGVIGDETNTDEG
jgi:hypothetical protein